MIPKRIVFAGSSSLHGHGDSEMGGFVHRFRLWHEAEGARHFVYELGIFGEPTAALLSRLASETRARKPHLIALYPGFNDMRRDGGPEQACASSIAEYEQIMRTLIATARSVSDVMIMTGFPFDPARTRPYGDSTAYYLLDDAQAYTRTLRSVCRDLCVPVLDYFALWSSQSTEGLLADDGLHANPAGHALLYEQLRAFMLSEYG
ncbi:MAG: GDSL-type esterase/lipase family protein [Pseudomonadota bacterium]